MLSRSKAPKNTVLDVCLLITVVLNAELTRIIAAHANKKTVGNGKAQVNYILSNDLCKPLEIYVYVIKKHPSSGYPAAKHPKHSKFAITDIREKPVNFFYCSTRASTLVSATILLTQVPLQKFPFLFISIIRCYRMDRKYKPTLIRLAFIALTRLRREPDGTSSLTIRDPSL